MITLKFKNLEKFERLVKDTPRVMGTGAYNGIEEAMDLWEKKSKELAMEDTGELIEGTKSEGVEQLGSWLDLEGTIKSEAYNGTHPGTGTDFNYALYWHERYAAGKPAKNLSKAGSVGNALDVAGENNANLMISKIKKHIRAELKGRGW